MALIYSGESYAINGAAMEVYNQLGQGFLGPFTKRLWKRNFC